MDERDDELLHDEFMIVPAASVAWQMFTQTGMPGWYLLYRDIERGGRERSPLD